MIPASSQPFFLYARKSTDVEDKQVLSIEAQLFELREFAKRENLHIVDEYIEKQSAKIPGRPIFNAMMKRIEKKEASGIISWHPDRLARNSIDGGKLIYLLDTGVLLALKFPQFWFEPTPQGKFMLNIAFGQSKYYVDSLSENTKRGLRQKVRRGEFPGIAPLGYMNDVRTKRIIVDKEKASLVHEAFLLYSHNESTLEDIAHFFSSHHIVSRGNKDIKRDRITNILSDPFYIGLFRYDSEIHEGIHEPIISKKLYNKVQSVLQLRSKPQKKTKTPKAFMGLLRCGTCGMMITAEQKPKFIHSLNQTITYTYYRCTRKCKHIHCDEPFIREEALNNQLSHLLANVSLRPDWATHMREQMEQDALNSSQSVRAIVAEKQTEVASLSTKLQRLLDSYLDQDIEKEVYRTMKQKLLISKKTLEESIATLQQSQNAWLEPMQEWISDASNAVSIARGTDFVAKRVLLQKIFGSNLILSQQKARGDAREPWSALMSAPTSRNWVGYSRSPRTYAQKTGA